MRKEQEKMPKELKKIVYETFAIARWAFGAEAIGKEAQLTAPNIVLIKEEEGGRYSFLPLDEMEIPHRAGRDRADEIAEASVKFLAYGVADYIVASSIAGLFVGDQDEADNFHCLRLSLGIDNDYVQEQMETVCSFSIYDLSGVIARTFATEKNCIRYFLLHNDIKQLVREPAFDGVVDCVSSLSDHSWVFTQKISEEECNRGPLSPDWSRLLFDTLRSIEPDTDQ